MPVFNILRSSNINRTARVVQAEGIFDIPPSDKSKEQWNFDFSLPDQWNIGLIVGLSGSGKTTIAREVFKDAIIDGYEWSKNNCILDDFPKDASIKDIIGVLSSVGFSSPPSWLKPYDVLSNGEKFRVMLARSLFDEREIIVFDEYSSVVDRNVAMIGSAALQKTVRRMNKKFVAVSCHYDIVDWLEPDWIFEPQTGTTTLGRSHRRPPIEIEVKRVDSDAWKMFRKYHYLDTNLNKSAACFCGFYKNNPVVFTAVLHFPHPTSKFIKREHRTVCLPDYQGVGIGGAMSAFIGSVVKGIGCRFISQTSHPAVIYSRCKSNNWKMIAKPNITTKIMGEGSFITNNVNKISNRTRASFEFIGKSLDKQIALDIYNGN